MNGMQIDVVNPGTAGDEVETACAMLRRAGKALILCHASPDGDTIGSAFALARTLASAGKPVRVECSDVIPDKYDYIREGMDFADFTPDLIVASDVASETLLGDRLAAYRGKVDLCIDHHPSNTHYARVTLLRPGAAATCEIMADVIDRLGIPVTPGIAGCLYTGVATDTGCFRYSNTRPATLRLAARLIEQGADAVFINKRMFETVSRERLALERLALSTLKYYMGGRVAVLTVTRAMCAESGAADSETEGLPSLPARIAGVEVGITVKEKEDGRVKVSVRTGGGANASDICARLGGGGHANAAGCAFTGRTVEQARDAVLQATREVWGDAGNP